MKIFEVTRRGFLKGLAGAAATAATPGGIANLATTVAEPAAAPAAAGISALQKMFAAATMYGRSAELRNPDDADDNEYDDYDPEAGWDETLEKNQGDVGDMPWGSYYEVHTSGNNNEYLYTSDPDGNVGIFSFVDKDGNAQYFVLQYDRTGWGDMIDASEDSYFDVYSNSELDSDNGEPGGPLVDAILDGTPVRTTHQEDEPEDHSASEISRISRLAGLAKKGYDKLTGSEQEPTTKHMGDVKQDLPALPAPDDSNTLEPNLRQKDSVPIKKHK